MGALDEGASSGSPTSHPIEASKMFETALAEGYARLQKEAAGVNETIFALRVDGDRIRDLMGEQSKEWQSKCDLLKQTVIDKEAEVSWARFGAVWTHLAAFSEFFPGGASFAKTTVGFPTLLPPLAYTIPGQVVAPLTFKDLCNLSLLQ